MGMYPSHAVVPLFPPKSIYFYVSSNFCAAGFTGSKQI